MNAVRIETIVEQDGELRLRNLPCKKGDRVEAVVLFPQPISELERQQARDRFLVRARASRLNSPGPFPSSR